MPNRTSGSSRSPVDPQFLQSSFPVRFSILEKMTPDHTEFPVTSRKLKRYTLTQCSPLGCFYVVGFRLRGPLWHILALDHQYSNVTRWEIVELWLSLESHRKSLKCLRTTSKCSRKTDVCRRLTSKCHRKPRFVFRRHCLAIQKSRVSSEDTSDMP